MPPSGSTTCVPARKRPSRRSSAAAELAAADPDGRPFAVESRVVHDSWGERQVLGYEGDTMTVLFDDAGYRTLSVDLVLGSDLLRPA